MTKVVSLIHSIKISKTSVRHKIYAQLKGTWGGGTFGKYIVDQKTSLIHKRLFRIKANVPQSESQSTWDNWPVIKRKYLSPVNIRLLRVPWTARRSNQSILREINPKHALEGLMLKWKLRYFDHLFEELTPWKRPRCWERLKVGGEGDDRGWGGWMAWPTRWTWVWASSESWWRTGRPGELRSLGSDTTERLNNEKQCWREVGDTLNHCPSSPGLAGPQAACFETPGVGQDTVRSLMHPLKHLFCRAFFLPSAAHVSPERRKCN